MNDTAYGISRLRAVPSARNDEEERVAACARTDGESRAVAAAPRIAKRLTAWWEANARDLPWRFGRATPWGVLVSEVMSQQTQMSRVVPYWQAWMELWPDATALAGASTAEVITMWGRLGYPRRALRLQECAQAVSERYADELPRTYEQLVALPGIGDYTASAVMSFAFGRRIAVIDTNIRRVLSRVFLGKESMGGAASATERELANTVLPQDPSASVMWNQSVMELGAVVCVAKKPLCERCPIAGECLFLESGLPGLGEKRTRPRQRFQGTDRQVRGIVLNALRTLPGAQTSLPREQVESLWKDHVQLDSCIASLDEDGLIEILADGSLRLPR
ncbi:HhH-GPD family protein [Bifidobacterium eulemuris]|uniref:Adenine DNA glycosylase n=1 Tax=Bifidobacterium eulemuris TaxID=1765219 RepID=A0A7L9SSB5_9BIFI|nr:A/G-specific adenine glycosylase [Bifidobacterium eulemuris]